LRERGVETLRGVAILGVVLAHVIGMPGTGLEVRDDSFLRWLFRITVNYRMPLFAAISGYVYSVRPLARGSLAAFWRGKSRRILFPLLFVSTLQYVVSSMVPGTHYTHRLADIWRIYCFTYDQFWFLQGMLLVFVVVPWLEWSGCFATFRNWVITLGAALLVQQLTPKSMLVFSFYAFPYLLVAFVLGVGLQRFPRVFETRTARVVTSMLLIGCIAAQQIIDVGQLAIPLERDSLLGLFSGLVGSVFLFVIRADGFAPLAWLGNRAYEIFLFHRFGQAGSRILLHAVGVQALAIQFAVGMLCGIGVPLLLGWLFRRTLATRTLLLGEG
jgi:fucose 4-O-acetylase-like acetyltransferase